MRAGPRLVLLANSGLILDSSTLQKSGEKQPNPGKWSQGEPGQSSLVHTRIPLTWLPCVTPLALRTSLSTLPFFHRYQRGLLYLPFTASLSPGNIFIYNNSDHSWACARSRPCGEYLA